MTFAENIKKVSSNDVQRAAQKFLGVNKSAISIAMPKNMEKENFQKNLRFIPIHDVNVNPGLTDQKQKDQNAEKDEPSHTMRLPSL